MAKRSADGEIEFICSKPVKRARGVEQEPTHGATAKGLDVNLYGLFLSPPESGFQTQQVTRPEASAADRCRSKVEVKYQISSSSNGINTTVENRGCSVPVMSKFTFPQTFLSTQARSRRRSEAISPKQVPRALAPAQLHTTTGGSRLPPSFDFNLAAAQSTSFVQISVPTPATRTYPTVRLDQISYLDLNGPTNVTGFDLNAVLSPEASVLTPCHADQCNLSAGNDIQRQLNMVTFAQSPHSFTMQSTGVPLSRTQMQAHCDKTAVFSPQPPNCTDIQLAQNTFGMPEKSHFHGSEPSNQDIKSGNADGNQSDRIALGTDLQTLLVSSPNATRIPHRPCNPVVPHPTYSCLGCNGQQQAHLRQQHTAARPGGLSLVPTSTSHTRNVRYPAHQGPGTAMNAAHSYGMSVTGLPLGASSSDCRPDSGHSRFMRPLGPSSPSHLHSPAPATMRPSALHQHQQPQLSMQQSSRHSKDLLMDIAKTLQAVFPYDEVAERQHVAPAKVRGILERVIQPPLLHCSTLEQEATRSHA